MNLLDRYEKFAVGGHGSWGRELLNDYMPHHSLRFGVFGYIVPMVFTGTMFITVLLVINWLVLT